MSKSIYAALMILCGVACAHATTITTEVAGHDGEDRSVTFEWTFSSGGGDCRSGQFANGDWWVAPASGQTSVTFTALTGTGSGQAYCDENPVMEAMGFLGKDYGNLVASENLLTQLPRSFDYSTSLVGGIQRDEGAYDSCGTKGIRGACIDAYHVVTVLAEAPAGGGNDLLRPNVVRAEKELLSMDDFDFGRLPATDLFTAPDPDGFEDIRRLWSHHIEILSMRDTSGAGYSEGGRAFRADLVTDDYAMSVARTWHGHVQSMFAEGTDLDGKYAALAAMLTYAKDIFYNVFDHSGSRTRWYGAGAGQSNGRFPPSVFFAALCRDPFYADVLRQVSSTQVNLGGVSVHELDQVNFGHNGPVWGNNDEFDDKYEVGRYWGEVLKNQKFNGASGNFSGVNSGQRTARDPYRYIDGPGIYPLDAYGGMNAGPLRAFAAEMYLFPDMCDITDYDMLVTYANRLSDHGLLTAPDPCAPPDPREDPGECDCYRAENCRYYGLSWDSGSTDAPTWGPDPDSVAAGNWTACIRNGLDPVTGEPQTGRYSDLDGDDFEFGYVSWPVENNWDAIRAGRSACTRPASGVGRAVPARHAPSFGVSPNPSSGFVRFEGPADTYLVYAYDGTFVGAYGAFVVLEPGAYLVTAKDGGMAGVVITE